MAKKNRVAGVVSVDVIVGLLRTLIEKKPNAREIANTSYGLGELAKGGQLSAALETGRLHELMAQLLKVNPNAQDLANTLYGLGALAKGGQLSAALETGLLHDLMARLLDVNPNAQNIAITIYALGELAKGGKLSAVIETGLLHALMAQLLKVNPNAQELANTIYGLGALAKGGKLSAVIETGLLHALMAQLLKVNPNEQELANTIYGLGALAKGGQLSARIDSTQLMGLLGALDANELDIEHIFQLLQGLSNLPCATELAARIGTLFHRALTYYIYPARIINLLDYYSSLSLQYPLASSIGDSLRDRLVETSLARHQFSKAQQVVMQRVEKDMPELGRELITPAMHLSSSRAPGARVRNAENVTSTVRQKSKNNTRPLHWDKACESGMFKAIAIGDLDQLLFLLGLEHVSGRSGAGVSSFARSGRDVYVGHAVARSCPDVQFMHKQSSDGLVTYFLKRTDRDCLKHLIEQASHKYFFFVLYACTKHTQYQLAIEYALHPLMLYLPGQQLGLMVTKLMDLGFYQDHQAILSLVDALFLRKTQHADESKAIRESQETLLTKAIAFHQKRGHHVVVPRLKSCLHNVQRNQETLLAMDDEVEDVLESSNAPVVSSLSLFNAASRKRTREDAEVYVENSLMRLVNGQAEVNMSAYYGAETVDSLLKLKLGSAEYPDVGVVGAVDYSPNNAEQVFREALLNYMTHHDESKTTRRFLLPIRINMHWVGVTISTQQVHEVRIAYHDSLESSPHQQQIKLVMEAVVGELFSAAYDPSANSAKRMVWQEVSHYKQDDGSSCGVYLVENMVKHACGCIGRRQGLTLEWRQEHLDLLRRKMPAYYATHVDLAANDPVAVPVRFAH
jgi:hypothetical protein